MRLVTAQFGDDFAKLFDAFNASVAVNMPDAELHIVEPSLRTWQGARFVWAANTSKLEAYKALIDTLVDADTVFIDSDVIVRGDLSEAFELDEFDVAYTVRDYKIPFNCGVVFVRGNAAGRHFIKQWVKVNRWVIENRVRCRNLTRRYGGCNQAAFGSMLDRTSKHYIGRDVKLHRLPCSKWNACDQHYADVDMSTNKVLHLKGDLRYLCLRTRRLTHHNRHLLRLVREFDHYAAIAREGTACQQTA